MKSRRLAAATPRLCLTLFLAASWAIVTQPIEAQEPPDSMARPDSVTVDTLTQAGVGQDSLDAEADSLEVTLFPEFPDRSAVGWATGLWEWDRDALTANRAVSLAQLIDQIPGTTALRGGDFGAPNIVTAFGAAGGRIRVFLDGFELLPLQGTAPDLAQIGLAGFQRIRVRRSTDGIRVDLFSIEVDDPRPYSLVETGTGDLNTNLFRGTFSHPRALGGSIALGLDRVDTDGTAGREPGAMTGGWLRYTLSLGSRLGIRGELRRITASRPSSLYSPPEVGRTDWSVRARAVLATGLVAEAFGGRSSAKLDATESDSLAVAQLSRDQVGIRLSGERPVGERGSVWAEGAWRSVGGNTWPATTFGLSGGIRSPILGGEGSWTTERLLGESATMTSLRAWTAPLFGVSVFGEIRDGVQGVPFRLDDPRDTIPEIPIIAGPAVPFTTDRKSTRVGAHIGWGSFDLGVARVTLEQANLAPFGFPMDSAGIVQSGGERTGIEASGRLPLYFDALYLAGSYQRWDKDAPDWRYLPKESWTGRIGLHDTFLPTENFEIWTEIGVEGREPMAVPFIDPESPEGVPSLVTVPFNQSWYFRLQIRIVTVHIFILTENFTARQELQDFPERFLPGGRSIYGIKWTLWN